MLTRDLFLTLLFTLYSHYYVFHVLPSLLQIARLVEAEQELLSNNLFRKLQKTLAEKAELENQLSRSTSAGTSRSGSISFYGKYVLKCCNFTNLLYVRKVTERILDYPVITLNKMYQIVEMIISIIFLDSRGG